MQIYIYTFSLNFFFGKFLDVAQSWEVKKILRLLSYIPNIWNNISHIPKYHK